MFLFVSQLILRWLSSNLFHGIEKLHLDVSSVTLTTKFLIFFQATSNYRF